MNKFDKYYLDKGAYHFKAYAEDAPFRKYIDSIISFFDGKQGQTILNVGSGEGLEAELLLFEGHRVDLLDISEEAVNLWTAREHQSKNDYQTIFYIQDFVTFNGKYDWILIPNTLNWMDDETELKAVAKIKELANIGAYITVADMKRGELDVRDYTKERLLELFPNAEVTLQDDVRWVVVWRKS